MFMEMLSTYKRTFIPLEVFEKAVSSNMTYEQFAQEIQRLEEQGILVPVKSAGNNGRMPSLSYKYKIQRTKLHQKTHKQIEKLQIKCHRELSLDNYYSLPPSAWEEDLPYIEKINQYIMQHDWPQEEVPAPERSLALTGDEKWIQEKNGKRVLERLQIWERMKIVPVHDPLSFAIHPQVLQNKHQFHLVVENKTTYDGLLGALTDTPFSTLIYGQGYKIIKSMEHFTRQIPLPNVEHTIYYFGDLDWEGIQIWHLLMNKIQVIPAIPFYQACLQKQAMPIKTKQKINEEALQDFLQYFSEKDQQQIDTILHNHLYLAQEVLSSAQLKQIWSENTWSHPSPKSFKKTLESE
ncbi:Wadjet anti-phage system protein JetD domain-containing protein [Rummeliibacillus suwonensis]|uniref:Wadjet anti-phage system protein JetD domain-containing protein n=1 Tax=Rummeliibacillus suwonensis TaxID=1306154 RepID=UPI001AAFB54B|nr:Wadjet anti-phage system protein JetD domain-containing protein [Rummeliibacillus suwonensis]MBO2535339.1 hypothetical protein [Rummeliibacillus suwonensis]